MTQRYNVAQRLAEGAPAVEHTQSYVWACHVLGYQHPDLTAYPTQVRDCYDTEADLNLWLLDDDWVKLRAAANTADEALSRQRAQHDELAEAWLGTGARAATEFLQSHLRAGEAVVTNIRAAAERCATLRDELWRLVDAKAATAIAVDDRRVAERPAWLAAAQIVLTGAADRSTADGLIEHQVKPYVDDDVRTDWLDVMRSTAALVDASFDTAINALNAAPTPHFDVPGDLAVAGPPLNDPPVRNGDEVPIAVIPAGAGAARADPPPAQADSRAPTAPPVPSDAVPAPLPAADALGTPLPAADPLGSALGDSGVLGDSSGATGLGATGLGGLGSSIGGLISQIVDAVGGLLGSLGDAPEDPSLTGDEPELDDRLDSDDEADAAPAEVDDDIVPAAPETPPSPPGPPAAEAPSATEAPPAADAPPAEAPPPDGTPPAAEEPLPNDTAPTELPPPPPEAPPPAGPAPDSRTPCEIAADELPQAGQ